MRGVQRATNDEEPQSAHHGGGARSSPSARRHAATSAPTSTMAPVRFTREEIERRNTEDDAVVIIDNVVCDLTHFLLDHPGGVEPLMEVAGKDASQCFHDVGHSEYARDWMKTFAIGEVVEEDRREVIPWPPSIIDAEPEPAKPSCMRGFLDAWGLPLVLAALAVLLYVYLFVEEEAMR